MRLQDTPKSCYEEDYEFLNRPTVIPMTVEYNEVETEEMRKNRFKMESQMIDMAVKMTKGYILKQVNAV